MIVMTLCILNESSGITNNGFIVILSWVVRLATNNLFRLKSVLPETDRHSSQKGEVQLAQFYFWMKFNDKLTNLDYF